MYRSFLSLTLVAAAAAMAPSPATAQFGPGSSAAANQLSSIRQSAIGNSYSVDAINRNTLSQSMASAPVPGLGFMPTYNSSVSSGTPVNRSGIPTFSGFGGTTEKPFANSSNGSTVSPYLNLFNQGTFGRSQTIDNYNVLVRPQLQQQSMNRQLQRQQQQLNMKVQAISARPAFEATGSEQMMATGHQTTFGYYSHFYPAKNRRR